MSKELCNRGAESSRVTCRRGIRKFGSDGNFSALVNQSRYYSGWGRYGFTLEFRRFVKRHPRRTILILTHRRFP